MPDNYYRFINEGIIPDCRGLTVYDNCFLMGYTQIDDTLIINNVFIGYANGFFGFSPNSDVYFESNSVTLESYTQFSSGQDVVFFSNAVSYVGNGVFFNTYVELGNVVDIAIFGGSNGQVLTTDGNGFLSWSNGGGGGGNASFIANGNSNVSIPSANGNVTISVAGNANIVTFTGTEARFNRIANIGPVGNLRIANGNAGEVLTTYGNGVVYWSVNGQTTVDSESWNYRTQLAGGNSTWINLTSSSVKNKPSYLTGTNVDANNYYPWKQGTSVFGSNTANGNSFYLANSTAAYAPANAAILVISDGDDNWYSLAENSMNGNGTYRLTFNVGVVSNVDAVIQFVPGYSNSVLSPGYYSPTELMYTVNLKANEQQLIDQVWNFSGNQSYTTDRIFVRNMTANSNVNFVVGSLTTTQS
jgi:hypothetical protein